MPGPGVVAAQGGGGGHHMLPTCIRSAMWHLCGLQRDAAALMLPGPAPGRQRYRVVDGGALSLRTHTYPLGLSQAPLGVCVPPIDTPWFRLTGFTSETHSSSVLGATQGFYCYLAADSICRESVVAEVFQEISER